MFTQLVAAVVAATTVAAGVPTATVEGRTADGARYTWPGVSFEGRFRGTGVGVVLDDAVNDYDVQVDGATVATLVQPGSVTHRITGLRNGEHRVRLVKRTESPWYAGTFGGFVPVAGSRILAVPAPRHRQMEFIGDSFTAGYGNMSTTRDCSTNGGVDRNSNADLTFGALTARAFGADRQIDAWSGMGMVRNYNGQNPDVNFRTYYETALQAVDPAKWPTRGWRPQVVVVGLGINDFSTAINPGERWTPESLVAAYAAAYHGFLDLLRARYGPRTLIVASATVTATPAFGETVERVVRERGDDRIRYWYYDDPRLDRLGCDWHPSANDHRVMAELLTAYLKALPIAW